MGSASTKRPLIGLAIGPSDSDQEGLGGVHRALVRTGAVSGIPSPVEVTEHQRRLVTWSRSSRHHVGAGHIELNTPRILGRGRVAESRQPRAPIGHDSWRATHTPIIARATRSPTGTAPNSMTGLGGCSPSGWVGRCGRSRLRWPSLSVASPRGHTLVPLHVAANGASLSCKMPPCVSVLFRIEVVGTNPIRREVE